MTGHAKVRGLNGFGLEVPELDQAEKFYRSFGLDIQNSGDVLRMRSPGRSNDEGILRPGNTKRLHHVSFYANDADIGPLADRIAAHGLELHHAPPQGWLRDGLWFQDPWETWVNISTVSPSTVRLPGEPNAYQERFNNRVDVALWQEVRETRGPIKLGHLLMFTNDWQAAERFYGEVLGLRTTDRADGKVAFMAAGEGLIDHHCFGLINSTHRGFQHASFQVASIDEIGLGAERMRASGFREGFGVGRHAIASNLFYYARDPWGSWIEYYADMDRISNDWVSRDWNDLPYIWGPEWSPEFWANEMNGNFEPC